MPRPTGSAFDALLETFGTDEDRAQFQSLAERNPAVRQFGLRQDDYSRKLDAHDAELRELHSWREWRENNWDSSHKMTKAEKAKQDRLEALETEKAELESRMATIEAGGSDMTFEDIEKFTLDVIKKQGLDPNKLVDVDKMDKRFQDGEAYVKNLNAFTANASLLVPYLNDQHKTEFGKMFDPEDFLKAATEAGQVNLKEFYKTFTAETRMKQMEADAQARIAKAQAEADAKVQEAQQKADAAVERLQGMGPRGGNPADTEGPQMGALQKKMLGLDKPKDGGSGAPEVPLGEGGVANYAAREFINRQAGR
jgi:hypothetical protein